MYDYDVHMYHVHMYVYMCLCTFMMAYICAYICILSELVNAMEDMEQVLEDQHRDLTVMYDKLRMQNNNCDQLEVGIGLVFSCIIIHVFSYMCT